MEYNSISNHINIYITLITHPHVISRKSLVSYSPDGGNTWIIYVVVIRLSYSKIYVIQFYGVDEWLICTVMILYTEACTVVRTEAGLGESFEVKVGLPQGSVLSPLLFAAIMDVVSSEARSGLPSELLYADDLVIMTPTIEQLGRRVADWRASLLGKGLKVNAGKSKVMVGR